jgi:hypothetical protein
MGDRPVDGLRDPYGDLEGSRYRDLAKGVRESPCES